MLCGEDLHHIKIRGEVWRENVAFSCLRRVCLQGEFYSISEGKVFPSMQALIDFHRDVSLAIYFSAIDTTLDIPCGDQRESD